jgi:hypothetical protein
MDLLGYLMNYLIIYKYVYFIKKMNKFNPIKFLKIFKEKIKIQVKFNLYSKIILIGFSSFCLLTILKYKLYSFSDFCFDLPEEKQIAKKLYPLIKYKYIESYYDEENEDVILLDLLYQNLIKIFKLNFKPEIFLIKSDLCFIYTLSTGSFFISDVISIKKNKSNNKLSSFIYIFNKF